MRALPRVRALLHAAQLGGCVPAPAWAWAAGTAAPRRPLTWWPWQERSQDARVPQPPAYPGEPHTVRAQGRSWSDDWHWVQQAGADARLGVRSQSARRLLVLLRQEGAHYAWASGQWQHVTEQLLEAARRLAVHAQEEPPERCGDYAYWTAAPAGEGQPRLMRRLLRPPGVRPEVVLRDELVAAHLQQAASALGIESPEQAGEVLQLKVSRDHRLLAYTVALGGGEDTAGLLADIGTGRLLPGGVIPGMRHMEWAAGGDALLYTLPDATGRDSRVMLRRLTAGPSGGADACIFEEANAACFVTVTRTKDWRYLLINSHSKLSSEVHLLDAADPLQSAPLCVQPRRQALEYFVEHCNGRLYILTNAGASDADYSLMRAPVPRPPGQQRAHPGPTSGSSPDQGAEQHAGSDGSCSGKEAPPGKQWELLLPERPGVAVTDMDMFDGRVVLHELHHGLPALSVHELGSDGDLTAAAKVPLPDWALHVAPGANQDPHSDAFRLQLSSPCHAPCAYDFWFATGELRSAQPGGDCGGEHSASAAAGDASSKPLAGAGSAQQHGGAVYHRLLASSRDGARVPLTVLHRRGLELSGRNPLLIYVYGAYGQPVACDYDPLRLALVERGWVVALAHVRGGGEAGRRWHAQGRGLLKPNSVHDLLACLAHLMDLGYTSPGLIGGHAFSAGGLALGAAVNRAPELFGAVLMQAPFVDALSSMLDPTHLLTSHEVDEWGDPAHDPQALDMLRALCPYHNLQAGRQMPPVLLTTGLQDDRVTSWGPIKYAAKLRHGQQPPGQHLQERTGRAAGGRRAARGTPHTDTAALASTGVLLDVSPEDGHYVAKKGYKDAEGLAFLVHAVERRLNRLQRPS